MSIKWKISVLYNSAITLSVFLQRDDEKCPNLNLECTDKNSIYWSTFNSWKLNVPHRAHSRCPPRGAKPELETHSRTVWGWRPWTVRPLGLSDNWLSNKGLFLSGVLSDTHINLSSLREGLTQPPPLPPPSHSSTHHFIPHTPSLSPLHPIIRLSIYLSIGPDHLSPSLPLSLLRSIPSTPLLLTC